MNSKVLKNKFTVAVLGLMCLTFLILPLAVFAAEPGPLVPECTGSGGVDGACGYNDLIKLGQNFLTWAIYLAMLAAVVAIVWAGFLYLSSGGDTGKIKKAHDIMWKVITGIVVTLAAWLIVQSVLKWLGVASDWTLLNY